ncbi:MAG: ATP-binding cassette domain-containing protein [Methylococcaceae bacterium]|nr:ATP-binding cassette domain-containing protein [Methylococcaceae bacterium]
MIRFQSLSLRRGTRLLFDDAELTVNPGDKVGLTGANGAGKSSLFGLFLGELQADGGALSWPPNWTVAHVAQETDASSRPAIDYVLDGDRELRNIEARLALAERDHDGVAAARLHDRLDQIGGYQARARAAKLMSGLGFESGAETRPVTEFSGGWRMRLNLAQALMCRSDLLLLDEPTNHLDLDAVIWLQDWLAGYQGTLLLISHDRDVLDAVTDHIIHIENQKLTLYTGNYSAFEVRRAELLAQRQAAYDRQQREIAHIRSFVDRFRAKATKARQAQSRLKALDRMELIAQAHADSPFNFEFREPAKLPQPLLVLDRASAGYGERPLLGGISLTLAPGDRIGLLGANGAGKSTLMKTLAGALPLLDGSRIEAQDLALGYFAQHQLEQLDPEQSPLWHLQQLDRKASDKELRSFLGGFGFQGDRALDPVAPFSGGEKARLALALLVYRRPNLLLLDEPTNHLDLEMRFALSRALQDYSGALVVVSHDRHVLRTVADRFWYVADGNLSEFDGDLDDYRQLLAERRNSAGDSGEPAKPAVSRKDQRRADAGRRQQLRPLQQALAAAERELERLHQRQSQIESDLADQTLYANEGKERLKTLLQEKAGLEKALEAAEIRWLEAGEALESAEKQNAA